METLDYTISSMDYEHNNRIYTNLSSPKTEYCRLTITSLTTMANFVVLEKDDYISIDGNKYYINDDYSDVNTASLVELLNSLIELQRPSLTIDISVYYDSCSRIYFLSTKNFTIDDCSYNLKLMLGLVNVQLPIEAHNQNPTILGSHYSLLCPDVGLYLSTPVLYLACNLGSNSYKNTEASFTSMRILMRLTNSFFAKQPICNPNGDYTTTVRCSDLSDIRFTLMDANYHEVRLLSPMYLTVQLEAIPDAEDSKFNVQDNIQTQLQMTEYAFMRDNTERGKEYSQQELEQLITMQMPKEDPKPDKS